MAYNESRSGFSNLIVGNLRKNDEQLSHPRAKLVVIFQAAIHKFL